MHGVEDQNWPYVTDFRIKNADFKAKQKTSIDRRHRVRDAPEVPNDTEVWLKIVRKCSKNSDYQYKTSSFLPGGNTLG